MKEGQAKGFTEIPFEEIVELKALCESAEQHRE